MQYINKVSPVQQIATRYHQITRHNQTITTLKDYKYNYNKNKRSSFSRTTQQKLDSVEISAQGLNALKLHDPSTPPRQINPTNMSYLSTLIANYEKQCSIYH